MRGEGFVIFKKSSKEEDGHIDVSIAGFREAVRERKSLTAPF